MYVNTQYNFYWISSHFREYQNNGVAQLESKPLTAVICFPYFLNNNKRDYIFFVLAGNHSTTCLPIIHPPKSNVLVFAFVENSKCKCIFPTEIYLSTIINTPSFSTSSPRRCFKCNSFSHDLIQYCSSQPSWSLFFNHSSSDNDSRI